MIKVAFIGAGSLGFTRRLVLDILGVPELRDTRFAFMDIDERNLGMVAKLCRRDIAANQLPARVEATTDRRAAVADADYIFSTVRVGGLEAFRTDIEIPLKYGVDQCVGDTLCAGGIMYAQRGIPCLLDFCRDIRAVAKPGALFMNYSNPMAMNTWACLEHGGIQVLGLCHGVHGGHHQITRVIELLHNRDRGRQPGDQGFEKIAMPEVDIVCAGINHQTWYIKVRFRGKDWTGRLLEGFELHPGYSQTEKVRIDVLRRFGCYSTESNGHLSEYLPWYRKRPAEIARWIDLGAWINGETGGYLRICLEGRNWFETEFPALMKEKPPVIGPDNRSHEHGSFIIEARETGRIFRGHFNVCNRGVITNLPANCVVEVPGYVDRNGISIPVVGDLPIACAATCAASVRVQEMAVKAAVAGDVSLLKQAMLHDPLVGAVCNPEEVWQMTDEMLVAQAKWLPQYAKAIPAAKERLRHAKIKTRDGYAGAARLPVRSVKELRAAKAAKAKGKGKRDKS